MPCWGSHWPFRVCKCILCCSQTSPHGTEIMWDKLMIGISQCCVPTAELLSLTVHSLFTGAQPSTLPSLHSCCFLSPSIRLPRSQGKGYSVLLFEVDICIIRLGCVIVSGLPHQRVLQRREGAVQPNNGRLPSSLTLQQACTCIPPTHPSCRSAATAVHTWTYSRGGVRVSKRKGKEGGGVHDGSRRAGVELRYLNMQSVNWL